MTVFCHWIPRSLVDLIAVVARFVRDILGEKHLLVRWLSLIFLWSQVV